jgi:hypothetical protein
MSIAISGKFHPKQPEKKLGADEANVAPIPAMVYQKSKQLGEQESDLTSFESPPAGKSPAKKLSGPTPAPADFTGEAVHQTKAKLAGPTKKLK